MCGKMHHPALIPGTITDWYYCWGLSVGLHRCGLASAQLTDIQPLHVSSWVNIFLLKFHVSRRKWMEVCSVLNTMSLQTHVQTFAYEDVEFSGIVSSVQTEDVLFEHQ